jgi:hypothetical protein
LYNNSETKIRISKLRKSLSFFLYNTGVILMERSSACLPFVTSALKMRFFDCLCSCSQF